MNAFGVRKWGLNHRSNSDVTRAQELVIASFRCSGSVIDTCAKMHQRAEKFKQAADSCKRLDAIERNIDSWKNCVFHSLKRSESTAGDITDYQEKVGELEDRLKLLQDTYLHTKTVKETKHEQWLSDSESLSSAKCRTKDLKKMIQVLSERRREREDIISEQLSALAVLEERSKTDLRLIRGQQEAVAWYNRVLGFRIEAGQGIKFIFVNIDLACPDREFSFTIRHSRRNDHYTLLDCDPCLESSRELLDELNRTNDLFKFVRVMREMFQTLSLKDQDTGNKVGSHYLAPDEISHESGIPVTP